MLKNIQDAVWGMAARLARAAFKAEFGNHTKVPQTAIIPI